MSNYNLDDIESFISPIDLGRALDDDMAAKVRSIHPDHRYILEPLVGAHRALATILEMRKGSAFALEIMQEIASNGGLYDLAEGYCDMDEYDG